MCPRPPESLHPSTLNSARFGKQEVCDAQTNAHTRNTDTATHDDIRIKNHYIPKNKKLKQAHVIPGKRRIGLPLRIGPTTEPSARSRSSPGKSASRTRTPAPSSTRRARRPSGSGCCPRSTFFLFGWTNNNEPAEGGGEVVVRFFFRFSVFETPVCACLQMTAESGQ